MNWFGSSECSSGCESGWTLYFEHSHDDLQQNSTNENREENTKFVREDQEEEDLSMVSDASSGPPQDFSFTDINVHNQNNSQLSQSKALTKNSGKRQKKISKEKVHSSSFLDDTASSPLFNPSSKNNFAHQVFAHQVSTESVVDFSQGFSTTHFHQEQYQDHYANYLQSFNTWKSVSR